MKYAQIKDGIIRNIIVLNDLDLLTLFSSEFDFFIRVDNREESPGIGWGYDDNTDSFYFIE